MSYFDLKTRNRSWMLTIQIKNMENAGLTKEEYENPEIVADFFIKRWEESGTNRHGGIVVCRSKEGLYHAHAALYGNTTTLKKVAEIMYGAHVEPVLGSKKTLIKYLLKEDQFAEKGEEVLYQKGIENIQTRQGERTDMEEVSDILDQGLTPVQIFRENLKYRKYEKLIKSEYVDRRLQETPLIKEMHNEWHVGESGSGKSYYFYQLCEEYGEDQVYMCTDFQNGGLDLYLDNGAPPILFMDEFKGNMNFSDFLVILDVYSRSQIHSRYVNAMCLWERVIVTSVFPPEKNHEIMAIFDMDETDSFSQLLRRLEKIVYHYKEDGEFKTFELPAADYKDYDDLKARAKHNQTNST